MDRLTTAPLDRAALERQVGGETRGALASFVGTVRDHHDGRAVTGLSYTAYGSMAEQVCRTIVAETEARWPVSVALAHRLGELAIGEAAVMIVVAGDHRDEAFAACRHVIEEVKRRVPIWKRERYRDGSEAWVDPTAPGGTLPAGSPAPGATSG